MCRAPTYLDSYQTPFIFITGPVYYIGFLILDSYYYVGLLFITFTIF